MLLNRTFNLIATFLAYYSAVAAATNVHANNGCILVGGVPTCEGHGYTSIAGGANTIYARFDGGDRTDLTVFPGCRLDATWPAFYGDIYFGADNCLYDAKGQNIGGQCCEVGSGGNDRVTNPYFGM